MCTETVPGRLLMLLGLLNRLKMKSKLGLATISVEKLSTVLWEAATSAVVALGLDAADLTEIREQKFGS